jgi:hypothetical protein
MVLSAINQYPNKAYAGMIDGLQLNAGIDTFMNNAPTTAGVYDLVFTAVNGHVYTATIYGVAITYTGDGSATLAEIRDGMIAAIDLQPALLAKISRAASGNNVRITELDPATNGSANIIGLDADTAVTVVTAHSEPEPLPAGIFVAQGPNFQDCRLPRASGDLLRGIVAHQHQPIHELKYPGSSKLLYPPFSQISVVKKGLVWCITEEAVALTDTPFVRYAPGAGGTQLGAVRKSADTATAVSLSGKAQFRRAQATAGGLVLVEVSLVP